MHNELTYQAKRHAIFEKLSKENIKFQHLLPHFFFFLPRQKNSNLMYFFCHPQIVPGKSSQDNKRKYGG